jgi:phthalate 4,5-dioxygenase oxygenase subunit
MGKLMREYWLPALISSELVGPDGPPLRVRLLGENPIAFRVTFGRGRDDPERLSHRGAGASLFFGRNEEEGLRCVHHGWKFDYSGQCVDMPSEPAESNFKRKIHPYCNCEYRPQRGEATLEASMRTRSLVPHDGSEVASAA